MSQIISWREGENLVGHTDGWRFEIDLTSFDEQKVRDTLTRAVTGVLAMRRFDDVLSVIVEDQEDAAVVKKYFDSKVTGKKINNKRTQKSNVAVVMKAL